MVSKILSGLIAVTAWILSFFLYSTNNRSRRILRLNSEHILGMQKNSPQLNRFVWSVYYSHATILLETLFVIIFKKDVKLDGFEDFQAELLSRIAAKPVFVVAAHYGSWELVAFSVAKALSREFFVLAKPSKYPLWNKMIVYLRKRAHSTIIWNDSGSTVMRTITEAIECKKAIGFVMDQNPARRSSGVRISFFGKPAQFVEGPAKFALRFGAETIVTSCTRTGSFRYKIVFETISQDSEQSVYSLTEMLVNRLENQIKDNLEQWCWEYKKWKL